MQGATKQIHLSNDREAYYNTNKPSPKYLHMVSTTVSFSSKCGGGEYVVTGHINCDRCNEVLEEREWWKPTLKDRKRGFMYENSIWCFGCGLWKGDNKKIIN